MTTHRNNFAGQAVGTNVTAANSADSGDAFTSVAPGTGTIEYAGDPAGGGLVAITLTPGSSSSCYVRDESFNATTMAVSDCFYYTDAPSSDLYLQQFRTAAGNVATVVITSAGMVKGYNQSGSTVDTGATALTSGHWYRIETQVLSDASAGTLGVQWYVDNGSTQTGSISGSSLATRGGAITRLDRGPNSSSVSGAAASWTFTNLQAADGTTTALGAYPTTPTNGAYIWDGTQFVRHTPHLWTSGAWQSVDVES